MFMISFSRWGGRLNEAHGRILSAIIRSNWSWKGELWLVLTKGSLGDANALLLSCLFEVVGFHRLCYGGCDPYCSKQMYECFVETRFSGVCGV